MYRTIRQSRSVKRPMKKRPQRCGAAVVEFALIAPVMILLTMGMMEMGRVVMVQQILVNASREGARLAVLPGATTAEVVNQVNQELISQTIPGATISTTPADLSTAQAGTAVTVTVSVPAASVSWVPNPVFTVDKTLEAETTMRRESN